MNDDARTRTLGELRKLHGRVANGQEDARAAQEVMDDLGQRIRQCLDWAAELTHSTLHGAADIFELIVREVKHTQENMPRAAQMYGAAMEKAQQAATGVIVQTEGTYSNLPDQAIAAAAMAQLSWANASGNAVQATATLEEVITVPQREMVEKLKEAAHQMFESDREATDAHTSANQMKRYIDQYEQSVS